MSLNFLKGDETVKLDKVEEGKSFDVLFEPRGAATLSCVFAAAAYSHLSRVPPKALCLRSSCGTSELISDILEQRKDHSLLLLALCNQPAPALSVSADRTAMQLEDELLGQGCNLPRGNDQALAAFILANTSALRRVIATTNRSIETGAETLKRATESITPAGFVLVRALHRLDHTRPLALTRLILTILHTTSASFHVT